MPTEDNKTLKYNHGEKSLKALFTIYADLEYLLIKEQSCQNNPKESYTERKAKHEHSGYSLSLISSFNSEELATKITNHEEKDMIPLTDNENKFYEEQRECHICKKEFCYDKNEKKRNLKYTEKLQIIVIIQENLEHQLICNLNYKVPQEIAGNIYNDSTYDYHFIVFDNMVADMINNKKIYSVLTKLFIRGRKLNISLVFIIQSYFKVPKDVRLNTTHFFIAKISIKIELQQIAINHLSEISSKGFINIYRKCTVEPYSVFVNDTTLQIIL